MLLKEVMKDYLEEEKPESSVFGLGLSRELPCITRQPAGWQETNDSLSRVFKFQNRSASRHFVQLVLDYEENTGLVTDLSIDNENSVSLEFSKFNITKQDSSRIVSYINSMFLDAKESYKFE